MFFKNQGHKDFWQQIQGQSLVLKDVWQPYPHCRRQISDIHSLSCSSTLQMME